VYIVGFVSALLALAIPPGSILTALGLFSAAFGLGARPLISDYLAGVILIFEDQFSVGDKVEMMEVIGIVEAVNLRTTQVRATSGELYIVPNGDVRIVRNLSRGTFSVASIKVTVASEDLSKALQVFESVADTAQDQLHDLIERPEFVSEEGAVSSQVQLTLLAKAAYGRGARLRTQLMAWVIDALNEAGVRIIG
jgi:small conductance mechanosensitive channel